MGYTQHFQHIKDGTMALYAGSARALAGGQAVKITANGIEAYWGGDNSANGIPTGVIGVAKLSKSAMAVNGQATVMSGASKGELVDSTTVNADDIMPVTGAANLVNNVWVVGDPMYVRAADGMWTNKVGDAGGTGVKGIVTEIEGTAGAPTKIVFRLYDVP